MVSFQPSADRCAVFALMAYLVSAGAAAPAVAKPRFDGAWNVSIVTEKGECDRGYAYPILIEHGSLSNGGAKGFIITGNVTDSGAITVVVSRGDKSANGSGRLSGKSGSGKWRGGACSGTWTAERSG